MGFGWLLIGYLLLFPVTVGFFYTVPVAAVFLCLAGYRLARVNRPFGVSFYLAILAGVTAAAAIVLRLVKATAGVAHIAEAAALVALLAWHIAMLTGMSWVTKETGLTKLYAAAYRNRFFACIYFALAVFLTAADGLTVSEDVRRFLTGANYAVIAVGLLAFALNAYLLFRAYANICMPEDLDMPRKASRFRFVNEAREKADAREEAARELSRRKQTEYRERRQAEWAAKQEKKKGKKK